MREPKIIDYLLLTILALIWSSAFFNIKIATYSFGPITIAFFRVFLGAIPVVLLCLIKKTKMFSINPLEISVINSNGKQFKTLAVNEISLLRQSRQTAILNLKINN